MTSRSVLIAAAVVLSAALINPTDGFAQRQRSPGGNGNGRQERNGGERQRENGGGGAAQRDGGGSRQRGDGGRAQDSGRPQDGGRPQDSGARPQGSGNGRAEARAAQPRGEPVDRGDRGNRSRVDNGRREAPTPTETRESTPPPQVRPIQPPSTASVDAGSQNRQARRRFPTEADRVDANRSGTVTDSRVDRGGAVRGVDRTPNGTRVAVPRSRAPYYGDRNERNVYGSYYGGRNVYGRYAYRGSRNIYIVPRGYTYYYYPRYYYNPYSFGYGPAGRGHFYFDLYYNSYIWHPYSVYRYDTYGSYGYPVGELRLKVHPTDAQVFIDGYYAGRVDDFDGVFQSLRLEEGEYQVEIVLPGYEPLAIDVRIYPGQKTTYEGDLIPERP